MLLLTCGTLFISFVSTASWFGLFLQLLTLKTKTNFLSSLLLGEICARRVCCACCSPSCTNWKVYKGVWRENTYSRHSSFHVTLHAHLAVHVLFWAGPLVCFLPQRGFAFPERQEYNMGTLVNTWSKVTTFAFPTNGHCLASTDGFWWDHYKREHRNKINAPSTTLPCLSADCIQKF